jgi:hypothetical protein
MKENPGTNTLKPSQIGAGTLGQAGRGCALEHQILNAYIFTVFAPATLVAFLVHRILAIAGTPLVFTGTGNNYSTTRLPFFRLWYCSLIHW